MRNVTRRDFVKGAALAFGAMPLVDRVMLAQAQEGAAAVPASEQVRVGLVGCGNMGRGDLETFFLSPEVQCPIVCDVDEGRMGNLVNLVEARRGNRPDAVTDFRRIIDRNDVDVVLVATPDHWHALPTVYACQAGKDVYVEKPLAPTIDEGRAMLEAMRENKRIVQMGTQWRSGESYGDAVKYIQSGKLGKIRLVRAWAYLDWVGGIGNPPDGEPPAGVDYDMWLGPAPAHPFNPNRFHFNFRWYWDYAGGLMTDWGVHLLNICLWAMGPEAPSSVYSVGGKRVVGDNSETPDTQIAVYDFPSYNLIWEHQMLGGIGLNGHPHGMLFSGANGTLTIDDRGWRVVPEDTKVLQSESRLVPKTDLMAEEHPSGSDGRPAHVRNFLDCVKSREQPVENLEIGHHVSTVAHLGNLALRGNTRIDWDAENERVTNNPDADALVGAKYRAPWKLPYTRRG
jgi:predicted dehydrogenase